VSSTPPCSTGGLLSSLHQHATTVLAAAGVPDASIDARWLVMAATGHDPIRSSLSTIAPITALSASARSELDSLLVRRAAREPLQLVVGSTAFRTLTLTCAPGVFIPRPETEVLAGLVIDRVRALRVSGSRTLVLEPCCGTGAISLAVAAEVDGARVLAADLEPAAVALATSNRDGLAARGLLRSAVEVAAGDLLAAFDPSLRGEVDIVVANPPYLPLSDLADLAPEVAEHDPHVALFGGPEGHEVVERLLDQAADWLAPGGHVLVELDARRVAGAAAHAGRLGFVDICAVQDLTGADRFLVARRTGRRGRRG
jgi:release factor glutamine methyltransferase